MRNKPVTAARSPKRLVSQIVLTLGLLVIATAAVYISGGTKTPLPHLMYIPIALSAYFFGPLGAACTAVAGALMVGPWMPLDVAGGQMQNFTSWLFRLVFFCVIGAFMGALFRHIRAGKKAQMKRLYTSLATSLPNLNRLREDLDARIASGKPFTVLGFRIVNFDEINRFTSYDTGIEAMKRVGMILKSRSGSTVYSALNDEFMMIIPGADLLAAQATGQHLLDDITAPLQVDRYTMRLHSTCGFASFPDHAQSAQELLRMVGMALSLGKDDMGVHPYSCQLEQQSRKRQQVVSPFMKRSLPMNFTWSISQSSACMMAASPVWRRFYAGSGESSWVSVRPNSLRSLRKPDLSATLQSLSLPM